MLGLSLLDCGIGENDPRYQTTMQTTPISEVPDPSDYFRLTPVNLKTLRSPVKYSEMNAKTSDNVYSENFNLISKQLQNLLQELDVIYREVGYSNNEISKKEKQIFHSLSNSISKFFDEANEERNTLNAEYQSGCYTLQCMLSTIDDGKGVRTIPDLFMRNSLLNGNQRPSVEENCSSPQRASTSLLNRIKILNGAKEHVVKAYLPKFTKYLNTAKKLRHLMERVPDMEDQIIPADLKIPELSLCLEFEEGIRASSGDTQALFRLFQSAKDIIFHQPQFSNLSKECIQSLELLVKAYTEEYSRRLQEYKKLELQLFEEARILCLDASTDLTDGTKLELSKSHDLILPWSSITTLQNALKKAEYLRQSRTKEKEDLLNRCHALWNKLKVSEREQRAFLDKNSDLSIQTLENLTIELVRLEQMKKKLIKELIKDLWDKINEHFTAMSFTEDEMAEFTESFQRLSNNSKSLQDDECLLEYCESQMEVLKRKMNIYQPIWKLMEEFYSLQNDKVKLEQSTKDSSRLLARNSHKILLEEERTRKRLSRYLPSIVHELKEKLLQFRQEFKRPFLVNGQEFLDVILEEEADLLSKYPKSRINMKAPAVKTRDFKKTIPDTPRRVRVAGSTRSLSHPGTVNRVTKVNSTPSAQTASLSQNSVSTSHVSVRKNSSSRIPSVTVQPRTLSENHMNISSPSGLKRLTQLAPISVNALNIPRTQEKTLKQSFSPTNHNPATLHLSKPDITSGFRARLPSSPIKEPFGSVYSMVKSPEGKIKLNVSVSNNPGDSSFLNDSNFNEWKRSQLAKLELGNDENTNWNASPM